MARIIRSRRAVDNRITDRLTTLLQTIANVDAELTAKAAERSRLTKEAEVLYADMKQTAFVVETDHGPYAAQMVASAGRVSHTIDPAGFRKLVKDDKAFFGAITVLSKPAKELLSGKELASITTTHDAVPGEPAFTVGAVKVKGHK